jgi:hypothetical protein
MGYQGASRKEDDCFENDFENDTRSTLRASTEASTHGQARTCCKKAKTQHWGSSKAYEEAND